MTRVALLSSEPLRERMAGIGIRYLELARRLPRPGIEVVVVTAGEPAAVPPLPDGVGVRRFERGGLARILADCDAAVAQGQLANDLVLEVPSLPVAIDLYDPWLVEHLHYVDSLGYDPYRNDHATWVLQLARGDFFLCSSEEQRLFYLGLLTALGRVNPDTAAADPALDRLVAAVPFGVPDTLPPHRPLLPPARGGTRRILFGGLYDWYDPWTLLAALERLPQKPAWELLVIRNPNTGTPQRLLAELERRTARSFWHDRLRLLDWVPAERRYDLLRDVDVLVAPHRRSLETALSLRTRFLDALVAGTPVVTSVGGTMSRLLAEHGAGWVVPPEDPEALAAALGAVLSGAPAPGGVPGRRALLAAFDWQRVLAPLVAFLAAPRVDPTKETFAFRPGTVAPPDRLAFRARRWLRRVLGAGR